METPFMFGVIESVDSDRRLLKLTIEPYGIETGWCRVLRDTFYPIPSHGTDEHKPQWPYESGQEVLVGIVRGNHGYDQYVVLGLIE